MKARKLQNGCQFALRLCTQSKLDAIVACRSSRLRHICRLSPLQCAPVPVPKVLCVLSSNQLVIDLATDWPQFSLRCAMNEQTTMRSVQLFHNHVPIYVARATTTKIITTITTTTTVAISNQSFFLFLGRCCCCC